MGLFDSILNQTLKPVTQALDKTKEIAASQGNTTLVKAIDTGITQFKAEAKETANKYAQTLVTKGPAVLVAQSIKDSVSIAKDTALKGALTTLKPLSQVVPSIMPSSPAMPTGQTGNNILPGVDIQIGVPSQKYPTYPEPTIKDAGRPTDPPKKSGGIPVWGWVVGGLILAAAVGIGFAKKIVGAVGIKF